MMNYVFSQELYLKNHYKPVRKGIWVFGDKAETYKITLGSEEAPLSYSQAVKRAIKILDERRYPIYKTIYLFDYTEVKAEGNILCNIGGKIKQLLKMKK